MAIKRLSSTLGRGVCRGLRVEIVSILGAGGARGSEGGWVDREVRDGGRLIFLSFRFLLIDLVAKRRGLHRDFEGANRS